MCVEDGGIVFIVQRGSVDPIQPPRDSIISILYQGHEKFTVNGGKDSCNFSSMKDTIAH